MVNTSSNGTEQFRNWVKIYFFHFIGMSFEQLEYQQREEKKKKNLESQRQEQFFLEQKIRNESSLLLQKLAANIASEFGINISEAQNLLEGNTKNSLWELSLGVSEKLSLQEQEKLQQAIIRAKEALQAASKEFREHLRMTLEQEKNISDTPWVLTRKLFSADFIQRGHSPESFTDEAIGWLLWIIDSTEAIILFLYGLGKWVLVTPYHLYLLATGKASYDGWKKI